MASHRGQHFISVIMPRSWVERIRSHATESGETMSAFVRRMVRLGIETAIANGTIHRPGAADGMSE